MIYVDIRYTKGRQIEVAKEILESKNVPYIVSAPLLIQDMDSWRKSGVQGLQTVRTLAPLLYFA